MRQALVSRGLSEFLGAAGAGLIPRNSGAAEFHPAAAPLSPGVLAGVPRPVRRGQWDGQDASRQGLQPQMGDAPKEWPTAHALPRATWLGAQAQLCDFSAVEFALAAPRIGVAGLHRTGGEIGTEQVAGREGQSWGGDNPHAGGPRAGGPDAPQEEGGPTDSERAWTAPPAQGGPAPPQAPGEAREQLSHAAGRAEHPGTPLRGRARTRGARGALVTTPAPPGQVPPRLAGPQPGTAEDPAIGPQTWRAGEGQRNCWATAPTEGGSARPWT
jgi:hypothetical protein